MKKVDTDSDMSLQCHMDRYITLSAGAVILKRSILISTYMLMMEGLHFPLFVDLASFFKELELPLHIYTPNTIRLLLDVDMINSRLWLRVGVGTILDCYRMVIM